MQYNVTNSTDTELKFDLKQKYTILKMDKIIDSVVELDLEDDRIKEHRDLWNGQPLSDSKPGMWNDAKTWLRRHEAWFMGKVGPNKDPKD